MNTVAIRERTPCTDRLIRWLLCCLGLLYVLAGNAQAVKLPDGQRIDTLFYGSGHAHQIQANGHTIADIERDALHREVRRSQGGLTLHTGYTPLGQIAWQRASALPFADDETPQEAQSALWWRYLYDARGEMVETRERLHGRTVYDYDRAGQLQLCSTEESGVERFVWDAAGNLLGKNPAQALPPLLDNLLKRFDGVQYEHDAWGQVTRRNGTTLQWDAEGRLLRSANRTHQATYRYDALGRRIAQRIEEVVAPGMPPGREEARETQFVWQGMRLAQERETGRGTRTYVYDPVRTYAPVARVDRAGSGDAIWYYHTNPAGTAKMVTDAQGRVVWDGLYGAWGKVLANDGGTHGFAQPLRMPGQYADEVSGLHYNTFRMYDPEAGRFISPDPIGLNGGLNLYQYAPNPISWIDPWGLDVEGLTSNAARREAMRQAGIPTSQQPISQSQNASGMEYRYEVPKDGGGTTQATVQQQTMDSSHLDEPHWEAGKVKTNPITGEVQMNQYDRPKIANPKGKAYYNGGTC